MNVDVVEVEVGGGWVVSTRTRLGLCCRYLECVQSESILECL